MTSPQLQEKVRLAVTRAQSLPEEERPGFLEQLHLEDAELANEVAQVIGQPAEWLTTWTFDRGVSGSHTRGDDHAVSSHGPLETYEGWGNLGGDPMPAIPGYTILEKVGQGGMGVVYKAWNLNLSRMVALKMIRVSSPSPVAQEHLVRFRAEGEALARLNHPHIVQVYASGEYDGNPYLELEFVRGESLDNRIKGKAQAPEDAAHLVMMLARAVHVAHQAGIIHRDLKPSNVLLAPPAEEPALNSAYGCPKIADFGLARPIQEGSPWTRPGMIIGSPAYMAPEQAAGETDKIGPTTDVCALGVLLYEMLSGRCPFEGSSSQEIVERVRKDRPVPPRQLRSEIPRELESICLKCLEKQGSDRYPSAGALADALQDYLSRRQSMSGGPFSSWLGHREQWALLISLGLLAMIVTGLLLRNPWRESTPGEPPQQQRVARAGNTAGHSVQTPWIDEGLIDFRVEKQGRDGKRTLYWLHQSEARPLRDGDRVQLVVKLKNPAYAHVIWFTADGDLLPLYPWQPGNWNDPSKQEEVQTIRLPEDQKLGWRVNPGKPGMEMLILLVRPRPLPGKVDLRQEIGSIKPMPMVDPDGVAWFVNGVASKDTVRGVDMNRLRGGIDLANPEVIEHPVVHTQATLYQRLKALFPYIKIVAFPNAGGVKNKP